jgi:[acyl-carrier-protein] S-malonyltransferase
MKLAFVFPGQGSQSVGMLNSFAENETVRSAIKEASDAISTDLWALAEQGPAESLSLTTNTQPIMLASAAAMYRAWREQGGAKPAVVAGHSLGEYTALVAADALGLAQATALVRFRAEAMQDAVPVGVGAMAAILGLDGVKVIEICVAASQGEVVEAVNFNDTAQTVIAGHKGAVERACILAKEAGAKRALPLPVSAPFHSSLLRPAADKLSARLAQEVVKTPGAILVNNVDVATPTDPAAIRDALARQACNPVRWVESTRHLVTIGVTHVVECGPGKVLAGLVKRIAPEVTVLNITDKASLEATLQALG